MTHCYVCIRRLDEEVPPDTETLPPMHPACHRAFLAMPEQDQAEWLESHRQGVMARAVERTRSQEDRLDSLELQLYGENSTIMPQHTSDTVKRLIYALSLVQAGKVPEEIAPTLAALAWQCDHRTGTAVLSDDDLLLCVNAILPTVTEALKHDRFLQAFLFRKFLREYVGPVRAPITVDRC